MARLRRWVRPSSLRWWWIVPPRAGAEGSASTAGNCCTSRLLGISNDLFREARTAGIDPRASG